jgi:site-specific DNA-methyltransferase (adenine-specific)
MKNEIWLGDCLELMKNISDKSIDCILCDLPYNTTACHWDKLIPFEPLWAQYKRIIKDNGAIVLFGSQPFTSMLIMSNLKMFKYEWIWDREIPSGHLNVKIMPLKYHENILVFSNRTHIFNRQFTPKDKANQRPNKYKCLAERDSKRGVIINEKEVFGVHNIAYAKDNNDTMCNPKSIISFSNSKLNRQHPTQKPVALCEYLIKTYTNEGDLVLDNCAGSGTTGVACLNTNRQFILIEKEENYFNIIKTRIAKRQEELANVSHQTND